MDFNFKMVIGIRTDLKISKGKAAQIASQIAISGAKEAEKRNKNWFNSWLHEGQKKVVIKIPNEEELLALHNKTLKNNISSVLLISSKSLGFDSETKTAIVIGPAPNNRVDNFTIDYKLL